MCRCDLLPGPAEYGIAPENAYLMLAAEFKLTPNTLKVRARKPDRRTEPVKRGTRFAFEGTDPIELEHEDEKHPP